MIRDGKAINPEARVETTNACNSRCSICPRAKMTRPIVDMGMGMFEEILEELEGLGITHLSLFGFGEPLCDETLHAKIRMATEAGMTTYITTNGSLLSHFTAKQLISSGLKNIRFSVHGIDKHSYQSVHYPLSFDKVMANIYSFLHQNNEYGNPVKVHISCIPMNGTGVPEIVKFWDIPEVDYLEVWRPHGWGGAANYRELNLKKKTCGRPFQGPIQIQADGNVIPCCFLTNAEVVLGNFDERPILEILTGPEMKALQVAHTIGEFGDLPCAKCDQRNEGDEPLLYSNREQGIGKLSTSKFEVFS